MKLWASKSTNIKSTIEKVKKSFSDFGVMTQQVVSFMPGMTISELLDSDETSCKIKTNEGIMIRENLTVEKKDNVLSISFDEDYQAAKIARIVTHVSLNFIQTEDHLIFQLKMYIISAPGFLGFIYKLFAKSSISNASLEAFKKHLEN